jgi:hypothetical protein
MIMLEYKKGDLKLSHDSRGITSLSHKYKELWKKHSREPQFKVALKRNSITHALNSADEFLMLKNNSYLH